MTSATLDVLAIGYQAALALAAIQRGLAAGLTLADPPLGPVNANCALIADLLAPAMAGPADAGTIVSILSADAAAIAKAAEPDAAAPAFYAAAQAVQTALPAIVSPARLRAASLAQAMCAAMEATWLGQAFVMEARSDFTDRQSALDARGRIAAAMDAASDRIALAVDAAVFELLSQAATYATQYIVAVAADLRPVVVVDAGRSFPSGALAYALYGDPARGAELAARNRCGTPLFMPAVFEALAPGSTE